MRTSALAAQQNAFVALLLDESLPLPDGWCEERFAIYRDAYRARVVDAVRETFPRTERWVGGDAFRRAAIHHVIEHPPRSWTLDSVGDGIPDTLAALFSDDPEVSELAWLEWAMHRCFVSADSEPMDAAAFQAATARFDEADWATMQLSFLPGTQVTCTAYRVDSLWRDLLDEDGPPTGAIRAYRASDPLACVVWRQDVVPVCVSVAAPEGYMLTLLLGGSSYGDACQALAADLGPAAAITEAGAMLGRWIHHGMLADIQLHRT